MPYKGVFVVRIWISDITKPRHQPSPLFHCPDKAFG